MISFQQSVDNGHGRPGWGGHPAEPKLPSGAVEILPLPGAEAAQDAPEQLLQEAEQPEATGIGYPLNILMHLVILIP